MNTLIQYIPTTHICQSPLNPRKEFVDADIRELSESIQQVGILSPIIIRPNVDEAIDTAFEIVCGARRHAAAKLINQEMVPCILKELSDEEALDLMITENLQRKDISPLEEAEAFINLIKHRQYDIAMLVSRFGKSEFFIRQRLKLLDLIPEFRNLLKEETIGIGHAFEICKLIVSDQQELYQNSYSETDRNRSWWTGFTVKDLKRRIERYYSLKLKNAGFSPEDGTLDTKAGPCTTCPKNSASNMILFPDSSNEGICIDTACFKNKSEIQFERDLAKIQEESPEILLCYRSYISGDEKKYVNEQIKKGLPFVELEWKTFETIEEPEKPSRPFASDFEETEDYEEALEDYKSELEEYNEDLKEYQEQVNSGNVRKAFIVAGNDKGHIIHVLQKISDDDAESSSGAKELSNKRLITELNNKDKRNQELRFEKIYLAAKELLKESDYLNRTETLSDIELYGLFVPMLDILNQDLRKEVLGTQFYVENNTKLPAAKGLSPEQRVRILRNWMLNKLSTSTPNSQISEANALIEIAKERYPDKLSEIELEQEGKYLKKKEIIDNKIAELTNEQ